MKSAFLHQRIFGAAIGIAVAASSGAALAQSMTTSPMTQQQANASPKTLIAQINVTCDTMVQQQKLIAPVHVVLKSSSWNVVTDPGMIAADRTAANVVFADVWKQNGKYVWVHAHRFTQAGAQRATQLCFRTDGTLARVRQATAIPALDGAGASRAYYYTNGTLIQKSAAFEENDPALAKVVKSLPYYAVLP